MKYMREAELKHGRVCMLAWAGWLVVDSGFRVPFAPAVSSLAAHDVTVKSGNMLFLLFVIGAFEVRAQRRTGAWSVEASLVLNVHVRAPPPATLAGSLVQCHHRDALGPD